MRHKIYALVDPNTRHVRYVGRTGQTPQQRLAHHVTAAKRGVTKPVYDWIRSLGPVAPVFIVLQEIENVSTALSDGCYESSAQAAETKWMKRFERSRIFNSISRNGRVYRRLVNP